MPYDNAYSNEQTKTSKYNEAAMQILRLNDMWIRAEHYARKCLLNQWKFLLDSIWRELYSDVIKHQKVQKFLKINKSLKNKISRSKNKIELYNCLDIRHQFLKWIQDTIGKGSMYGYDDDDDAE